MIIHENNTIRLSDLAVELNVTSSALRQHLKNKSPLGLGAKKFGGRSTGDYLLSIDSTLQFLEWLKLKAKKVKMEDILKVEDMLK